MNTSDEFDIVVKPPFKRKKLRLSGVSVLFKLRRYFSGFTIGMCLEYVYRVDTPYWYIPLAIAILQIGVMIVDCLTNER